MAENVTAEQFMQKVKALRPQAAQNASETQPISVCGFQI